MKFQQTIAYLAILLGSLVSVSQTTAQIKVVGQIELENVAVPKSTVAAMVAWPSALTDDPGLELLPFEIASAWSEQYFGMDFMKIEMLLGLSELPEPVSPPKFGLLVRFSEPVVMGGQITKSLTQDTFQNLPSYQVEPGIRIVVLDRKNFLVGEDTFLTKMLTENQEDDHRILQLLDRDLSHTSLHACVDIAALRPMIMNTIDQDSIPKNFRVFAEIPTLINSCYMRQELGAQMRSEMVLTAEPGQAAKLGEVIERGIKLGKEFMLNQVSPMLNPNDPVQVASSNYARRLADYFSNQLSPTTNGNELTFKASYGVSFAPIATALILPAVQQARNAARRAQTANNIRQIMLAMHNYESAYRKLPTNFYNDEGEALLSWRVAILPFIEQNALYEKFKLDEPWDSKNNLPLVEQMPEFLKSVDLQPQMGQEGHTNLLFVTGENMLLGQRKSCDFPDFTDGTSNTIGLVEVNSDAMVPWSKPQDYKVNPADPRADLGGIRPAGFYAGFMDGSVSLLPDDISPELLLKLFTPQGGEVVDLRGL